MATYELRACPWCKSAPVVEQDGDDSWYVACKFHGCVVAPITVGYKSAMQAQLAWNCCGKPDLMPTPIR